jgi:Transcriptional regulator, effector-binding domain/component
MHMSIIFAWFLAFSPIQDTARKPIINIEETTLKPMNVLVIPEMVTGFDDFEQLMRTDYEELFSFIKENQLQPGKVMAFYYLEESPLVMDVAVEVNQLPTAFTGRIKGIYLEGGKAVVIHYKGPYGRITVAYDELRKWLKKHHKKALECAFESYLNDPATTKDPWELRTDIYQRIR